MLAFINYHHFQLPRRIRLVVSKIPLHIIQRGNNRQSCFYNESDYIFYLDCLLEYSQKTNCTIHGYVLMTNQVHLLLTPRDKDSVGHLMIRLAQKYVQYVNRTYQRSGTYGKGSFVPVLHRKTITCCIASDISN